MFQLLIGKTGYQSRIVSKVDPTEDPVKIRLGKPDIDVAEDCRLSGTIVNEKGEPVHGALVSVTGAQQKGSQWWGQVKHVDRVVITGEDGKFTLTSTEGYEKWQLSVAARQMCKSHTQLLETGKHHKITMDPGTLVAGRVVQDGKPVAKHVVGIYPHQMRDFHGRLFTNSREIETDENGRFEFVATRPNVNWNIYSLLENEGGLIETEEFDSGATGKTKELGDFELLPVHTIRGTLKMTDGSALPEKLRLYLNRDHAWNHDSKVLEADGKFEFKVPVNELVELSFNVDGSRLSRSKNKFQVKDDRSFRACLDKKMKEYEVWLEPK